MDEYTEPKDARKLVFGKVNSSDLAHVADSDDEDDDGRYSKPFMPVAVIQGKEPDACQTGDVYEVAAAAGSDYDVPPSSLEDEYSRIITTRQQPPKLGVQSRASLPLSAEDISDDYNHTESWTQSKAERQKSGGSTVLDVHNISAASQEATQQLRRSHGVRKGSNSSLSALGEGKSIPNPNAAPALYEEAWDTATRQKRLEEQLRLARTISSTSDKFEDALEYLPEEPAPPEKPVRSGKQMHPVTGGTYEEAWDLNRGLEEKLRKAQLMHSGGDGGDLYQEPWDTPQKQRELEGKLQRASSGGGIVPPKQQQSGSDIYEEAWDTKRSSLSQLIMGPHAAETLIGAQLSTRSHQSVICCTAGEPINAMIPLDSQDWYHGNISRDDAEKILRVCKDGSYLVRDSSDGFHYTLCIKSARMTIHIQIDHCVNGVGSTRYILGKNSKGFETIPAMIDYYTQHPVPIKGADHMTLMYPVQCHWSQ